MRARRAPTSGSCSSGAGPDERAAPRPRSDGSGWTSRSRIEVGVSDERLHELYLDARGVYYGPFDEDYGYVTLEGMAAERPVVTLSDAGGPLEFVDRRRDRLVAEPEPAAIAEAFDRLSPTATRGAPMGSAGNAR